MSEGSKRRNGDETDRDCLRREKKFDEKFGANFLECISFVTLKKRGSNMIHCIIIILHLIYNYTVNRARFA